MIDTHATHVMRGPGDSDPTEHRTDENTMDLLERLSSSIATVRRSMQECAFEEELAESARKHALRLLIEAEDALDTAADSL